MARDGPARRAALVVAALLTWSAPAAAGPFDVYGFGSRAIGLGGAATAIADDYTAAFYNPANLVLRKRVHLGAEVMTALPNLSIEAPDASNQSPAPLEPDGFTALGLGVQFPLGGKVDYRFAFGLVLNIPLDTLLQIDALDPLVPRWYLWDSLAHKLQIIFAAGGQITDWLAVGVGFQSLADVRGEADVAIELVNEQVQRRNIDVSISNTLAPIVGLSLGPWHGLRFGFSWRAALDVEFELPVSLDLGEALDLAFIAAGTALYTPHTLSFGLGWEIFDSRWLISTELRYLLWSKAPDPAFEFAVDIGGELVEGLDLGDAVDLLPGPSGLPGFSDTVSFHLGAEGWFGDHVTTRVGYRFVPSPIPDQVGLTNFIDSDSHTLSLGLAFTYRDPLDFNLLPAIFEVTAALALLPEQETVKASAQDPVGNLRTGGEVLTLSFSLRHDF